MISMYEEKQEDINRFLNKLSSPNVAKDFEIVEQIAKDIKRISENTDSEFYEIAQAYEIFLKYKKQKTLESSLKRIADTYYHQKTDVDIGAPLLEIAKSLEYVSSSISELSEE